MNQEKKDKLQPETKVHAGSVLDHKVTASRQSQGATRRLLPALLAAGALLAVGLGEVIVTLRPSPAQPLAVSTAVFPAMPLVSVNPTSTRPPTASPAPTQPPSATPRAAFDGQRALDLARTQVEFGPRIPGSAAHAAFLDWAQTELEKSGWMVELQAGQQQGQPVQNLVARRGSGSPWVVLGAHYDSRLESSQDPDPAKRATPVPAANDGASGVAALLELARVLPAEINKQVWIVLLDAEDNGEIPGWDWTLGARYFVGQLPSKPDAFVLLDMIGDSDLTIYKERNSTPALVEQIWATAARLGNLKQFPAEYKYSMEDDHTPFLQAGIPAVDLIDFDYPYWHTTGDTLDKISAASLQAVGDTLLAWLQDPAAPARTGQ